MFRIEFQRDPTSHIIHSRHISINRHLNKVAIVEEDTQHPSKQHTHAYIWSIFELSNILRDIHLFRMAKARTGDPRKVAAQ